GEVRVETAGRSWTARACIITVPAWLLHGEGDERILFDPPLLDKQRIASTIGHGRVSKAVLAYPQPFWRDGLLDADAMWHDPQSAWTAWWTRSERREEG